MTELMGVVGPMAHGLAIDDDDPKVIGVYIADPVDVCGLHGPAVLTRTYVGPDHGALTMHELYKFATLALQADPAASELLWLDSHSVRTEAGDALVENRTAFLSALNVREAYRKAARHIFRRFGVPPHGIVDDLSADEIAELTREQARDCVRLLRQARTLLKTGQLVIDMSAQREDVFAAGELATRNPKAFSAFVTRTLADLESIDSVLPDTPDTARVDALLVELRMAALRPGGAAR
ncbi:DNA polymerase beta superfamily protein [Spongiactinospora sp. 9N601]|uniref:DNA polymerase beta superfamily protein n=1 Tax=Spongiactinospora sp. 9N601 TaxID=3375149 RepID=UPI0037A66D15